MQNLIAFFCNVKSIRFLPFLNSIQKLAVFHAQAEKQLQRLQLVYYFDFCKLACELEIIYFIEHTRIVTQIRQNKLNYPRQDLSTSAKLCVFFPLSR